MSAPDPEANRRTQIELYGAPLAELVRTVREATGLTQTAVAKVLGLSGPMLSQLVSGQRIKISNPAAVARLEALLELAHRDDLDVHGREEALARIAREQHTLTSQRRVSSPERPVVLAALVEAARPGELARVARVADRGGALARLLEEAAQAAGDPGDPSDG